MFGDLYQNKLWGICNNLNQFTHLSSAMKLVSFSLFIEVLPPPPPRPKMPFTYVVNVYSDMSLSKGHLGSRGGASKNKLKFNSFIFPMTNVTLLGVFRTHVQKEYGKFLEMKSIPILNILALLLFLN